MGDDAHIAWAGSLKFIRTQHMHGHSWWPWWQTCRWAAPNAQCLLLGLLTIMPVTLRRSTQTLQCQKTWPVPAIHHPTWEWHFTDQFGRRTSHLQCYFGDAFPVHVGGRAHLSCAVLEDDVGKKALDVIKCVDVVSLNLVWNYTKLYL